MAYSWWRPGACSVKVVNYLITDCIAEEVHQTDSLSRLLLFRGPVLKMHSRLETEHLFGVISRSADSLCHSCGRRP